MTITTEKNIKSLLNITNLEVSLGVRHNSVKIIRGFDLILEKGEIVGVLGESGSGKTVSSRMIAGLFEKDESSMDAGEIVFKGRNLSDLSEKEMNLIRGEKYPMFSRIRQCHLIHIRRSAGS